MTENKRKQYEELTKKECTKLDVWISLVCVGFIVIWLLLLCLSIKVLAIALFVIVVIGIPIIFMSMIATITDEERNNGKAGYYAQYDESYGSNGYKHDQYKKRQQQYIEDKIANKTMN